MRGTTIAGRYRLEEALGSGGMGEVWRAEDLHHGHDVALKIITLGEGDTVRESAFRREAGVAAHLSHPHVVSVRDHGAADFGGRRALFLAMDLVEGPPLNALITGPLPLTDTLTWTAQISRALHAAHQAGIVHRDVKPSNILINHGSAMLCDFGIARLTRITSHHTLTVTGAAIGTPAYMSPEQARGDTDLGAPSDMYSLGCLIHELLTGAAPFTGSGWQLLHQHVHDTPVRPSALRPEVPHELDRLVLELLDKDPTARPTAAETLKRLSRLRTELAALPTVAAHRVLPAPTALDRPAGPCRSARPRVSALWAGTVTGAAIAGELAWTTPMPGPWPLALGALAGLLLTAFRPYNDLQEARAGELRITTAGLFSMLLIAFGASVGLFAAHPSMWWAALLTAVLGGPTLVICSTAVRRIVQHVLGRSVPHADLAATAGALHTAALLLAANHAGFAVPATLTVCLALWPATALITAVLTSSKVRESIAEQPSAAAGSVSRRVVRATTAVGRS
ncbi:protein kinase [Streptomyces sp. NPDC059743]|uniref:serine/threonine-protein kinase n=1 Tax=Streptomyces sp. NPDC059743 TaxID=3346928 RepID=UPI003660F79A